MTWVLALAMTPMTSLLAPVSARHLHQAPLTIKLYCPPASFLSECVPEVVSRVANDIAAVDNYAADNGRQRVTYAGTINSISLIIELGTFDMLLVHTYFSNVDGRIFDVTEQAALASSLASGSLMKLMVW
jgi:hypothetical protein